MVDVGVAFRASGSEQVLIRFGDGTGHFPRSTASIKVSDASEFYKPFLRFVDVNEDGGLDILTGNERGSSIQMVMGDGRGGFAAPRSVGHTPGYAYHSIEIADVDRDGHLDLVTALRPRLSTALARLAVRRGNARGVFATDPEQPVAVLPDPGVAAVADLNGDDSPDVVLNHQERNVLSVLINNGSGRFSPAAGSPLAIRLPASAVIVADVNRDTVADLVATTVDSAAHPYDSEIVVVLGTRSRRFVPASGSPFRSGRGSFMLTSGDINADGRLDLAASSFVGDGTTLLLGQ